MPQILLIDDDVTFRSIAAATLRQAGHSVTEANDGRKGIAQFCANRADLVITDLVMPEKEGLETIMELRSRFPGVKIIAMSGSIHSPDYLLVAGKLGAKRTLAKPFTAKDLLGAVDAILGET